ncbi:putative peroxidase 61 [Nicotiana tabacum]|uniref:Peroxidase n=2 Tax=Nicotiana TaxID=4085 RepID=A0A1S3YNE2_TOBAC|nr:PREDICTED: probable peroxidase 61 [Nicotiana sylvestris]XP_016453816.1 PREDICTED: probable peroxidase 61 [Nicotiana tabacum]
MEKYLGFLVILRPLMILALSLNSGYVNAATFLPPEDKPLERHYYKKLNTCANVEPFVRHQVKLFWDKDKTVTAKLLKLLYADCMLNGCDASNLLVGPNTERNSSKNAGMGGGAYELIDRIKKVLEIRCPRAVSCTDILSLATRDAVHFAGGPSYPVFLGRRDGFESNAAWIDYPSPSMSWEEGLAYFESKNLDVQDFVTLLGAHSMGQAHCRFFYDRLYNFKGTGKPDPTMKRSTLVTLRSQCPKNSKTDSAVYFSPGYGSNYTFSNTFYGKVVAHESVLRVDQQLSYGADTNELVNEFAHSLEQFRKAFTLSINRMGGLKVLTGKNGEIRRDCKFTNKNNPNL